MKIINTVKHSGLIIVLSIAMVFLYSPYSSSDRALFTPYIEKHPDGDGRIDWDSGVIYGVGKGFLHHHGGNKNRALRAARVLALKSILKIASDLRLDHENTIKTLAGGRVAVQLSGWVRSKEHETVFVKDAKQPYFKVTLQAPLKGVEGLTFKLLTRLKDADFTNWRIFPHQQTQPPARGQEKFEPSFLVLDGRKLPPGKRIKPALFPQIVSADGEIIHNLKNVSETALVQKGMARYVESDKSRKQFGFGPVFQDDILEIVDHFLGAAEVYAEDEKQRKKRRKFIVTEVKQATGLNKTNLVISNSDAKRLKNQKVQNQILKQCRVIIVVSSPIGGIEGSLSPYWASFVSQ